jgi:internalin A
MMTLTTLFCLALAQDAPTPEATLAWLQSLDTRPESAQKKPRFPNLTVDDLKTMKDLRLGGHRASDNKHVDIPAAEFRFLLGLPALETLNLAECDGFDDESLVFVGKLANLKSLNLGDARVTNAGLKSLAGLKNLETLDLGFTKDVGDPGLSLLVRLPSLKMLGLAGTKVTDAGLSLLPSFKTLQEVRLGATAVTDRVVPSLEACKGLKSVRLAKTKVTPQGIERLKKALPGCTVTAQ